ncbi:hypothetical protein LR48_Vigan05g086400 [Vigna angularis]|uniref:Uncharacterized protein n=1 Tax=Phaseolus angularis TaxID=3914 RepID=A0A0L9UK45_PHAAN|nr:hypothetical protein LR48_Vigan05g086400 [Vigna angularis]
MASQAFSVSFFLAALVAALFFAVATAEELSPAPAPGPDAGTGASVSSSMAVIGASIVVSMFAILKQLAAQGVRRLNRDCLRFPWWCCYSVMEECHDSNGYGCECSRRRLARARGGFVRMVMVARHKGEDALVMAALRRRARGGCGGLVKVAVRAVDEDGWATSRVSW